MAQKRPVFRWILLAALLLAILPLGIFQASAESSPPMVNSASFEQQGLSLPADPQYLHITFSASANAHGAEISRENTRIDIEITEQSSGTVHPYTLTAYALEITDNNCYTATFYLSEVFPYSDLRITCLYVGDSAGNVTPFACHDAMVCQFSMTSHYDFRIYNFTPSHDTIIITPAQLKGEVLITAQLSDGFDSPEETACFTVNLRTEAGIVTRDAIVRQSNSGEWLMELRIPVTKQDAGSYVLDSISYNGKLVSTNHSFSFVVIDNAKLHNYLEKADLPLCYGVAVGVLIVLLILFSIWPHPVKWGILYVLEGGLAAVAVYLTHYYDQLPGGFFGGLTYMGEVLSGMGTVVACVILLSITFALNSLRPGRKKVNTEA